MKPTALLLLPLMITGLSARPTADAVALNERIKKEALHNLHHGTAEQKVAAAAVMGSRSYTEFIRPLGAELLRHIEDPVFRRAPKFGPFVKWEIAWALGEMRHHSAVPFLLEAFAACNRLIEEEHKKNQALREAAGTVYDVRMDRNKPGPALMDGQTDPNFKTIRTMPDFYWSASHRAGGIPLYSDPTDPTYRILAKDYNYVNLAQSVLYALLKTADVYGPDHNNGVSSPRLARIPGRVVKNLSETMTKALSENRIPYIRGVAAQVLGALGTKETLEALEARYESEEEDSVKVRISRAVLYADRTRSEHYEHLLDYLAHANHHVRLEAAHAFLELRLGEALHDLEEAIRLEADPLVSDVLKRALLETRNDGVRPVNY